MIALKQSAKKRANETGHAVPAFTCPFILTSEEGKAGMLHSAVCGVRSVLSAVAAGMRSVCVPKMNTEKMGGAVALAAMAKGEAA